MWLLFAVLLLVGLFMMLYGLSKKLPCCLYQLAWFCFGMLLFSVLWMYERGMLHP